MEELLEKIAKISGVKMAIVVDSSGNPISFAGNDELLTPEVAGALGTLVGVPLNNSSSELEELNLGAFKTALLEYENYSVVVNSISSGEMFLLVFMEPNSPNVGLVLLHAESVVNQLVAML